MSRQQFALAAVLTTLCLGLGLASSPPAMAAEEEKGLSETYLGPSQPVTAETVRYSNGRSGYFAQPQETDGPLPALIVIHEWWGLNENIQAMTERLAGEGYRALAIDLYGGQVAETRDDAMRLMGETMSDTAAVAATLHAAHAYLVGNHDAPTVGALGWSFGGSWSLAAAIALGDKLDAAVIYYGRLIMDKERLGQIEAPILGLFGKADNGIPASSVKAFHKTMKELGKPAEIMIYDRADHAFANPSGTRYDPEAAEGAWKRTTEFLERTLKKGESEANPAAG